MRQSVIVDRDGAIQLPEALRRDLDLRDGDDVAFEIKGLSLMLRKQPTGQGAPSDPVGR